MAVNSKLSKRVKNLVVVESPAKARTVGKLLGKDFVIKASMGHVGGSFHEKGAWP